MSYIYVINLLTNFQISINFRKVDDECKDCDFTDILCCQN